MVFNTLLFHKSEMFWGETLKFRELKIKGPTSVQFIIIICRAALSAPLTFPNYYYHHQQHFPVVRRLSRAEKQVEWRQLGAWVFPPLDVLVLIYNHHIGIWRDALTTTLSALYGKLLVVMGTAFPMAEVISTYIPPSFYEAYYLYLYIGSMFFLLYLYMVLLRDKRQMKKRDRKANSKFIIVQSRQSHFCYTGNGGVIDLTCDPVSKACTSMNYCVYRVIESVSCVANKIFKRKSLIACLNSFFPIWNCAPN